MSQKDLDITVDVLVEIPRGSRNKYEFDKEKGAFRLDRVLFSSVHYPTDYGYVPDTLAPDGDPADVLILIEEPTFPGCLVNVRPIGVLKMRDEKGDDSKVLAVPTGDPRYDKVKDLTDVSVHWLREIENFFETYKRLEAKQTETLGWADAAAARKFIKESVLAYAKEKSTTT